MLNYWLINIYVYKVTKKKFSTKSIGILKFCKFNLYK